MIKFTAKVGSVTFAVKVQTRASRSEVAGELDGVLKIRLAAPPVDGQANDELIRLLARIFSTTRAHISILSGGASKNKVIRIDGVSAETFDEVIGGLISD